MSIEEQLKVSPTYAGEILEDEETGTAWVAAGIGSEGRSDFVWFGPYPRIIDARPTETGQYAKDGAMWFRSECQVIAQDNGELEREYYWQELTPEQSAMLDAIHIEPAVYAGPPPKSMLQSPSGDVVWECECGATGISSNQIWAESDVNRHRKRNHLTGMTAS